MGHVSVFPTYGSNRYICDIMVRTQALSLNLRRMAQLSPHPRPLHMIRVKISISSTQIFQKTFYRNCPRISCQEELPVSSTLSPLTVNCSSSALVNCTSNKVYLAIFHYILRYSPRDVVHDVVSDLFNRNRLVFDSLPSALNWLSIMFCREQL